jgi:hypothetical protein
MSAENIERSDLDKHEFAQYIFQQSGTYFPKWGCCHFISPEEKKKLTLSRRFADMSVFTESIPNLKQRINQLQTRHTAQLEKLYAHQAAQYLDEALDQYMAQSDEANGGYSGDIDVCPSQHFSVNSSDHSHQKELYGPSRRGRTSLEARFDRETTLMRLAHVKTVAPLLSKLAKKKEEEEDTRKRRQVQFPPSAAEFYMIQDKELQQRISRFLTSDAIVQDKMLGEHGWEYQPRHVQELKEAYARDVSWI